MEFLTKVNLRGPIPKDKPHLGHCWIWTGYISPKGYGYHGKHLSAHRAFYEALIGPIPKGLVLDHLCRFRACVNPLHLDPVTQKENIRRGESGKLSGIRQKAKTNCRQGHPYSGFNLYNSPDGTRGCKICRTKRMNEHAKRKRLLDAQKKLK